MVKNTKKRLLLTFGMVVIVMIWACELSELCLRVIEYKMVKTPFSWFRDSGLYKIDSELYYRVKPSYIDGFKKDFTNELGMKVHGATDQTIDNPDYKLVILGDSFVWGETAENDTYPQQIQDMLNNMNSHIKTYNAGSSGYGTDQEYVYFIRYVLPHIQPDVVVWNININDISDNIYTPLFDIQKGELVPIPLWKNGVYLVAQISKVFPESIKRESRLLNLILRSIEGVRLYKISSQDGRQWSLNKMKLEIQKMQDLAKKHHFKLYIALDPMQCIVEKLDCEPYMRTELSAIKDFVDNKSDLIDQTEYFLSSTPSGELYIDESNTFPKGWWHPNARGNFLMAESVITTLKQYQNWLLN